MKTKLVLAANVFPYNSGEAAFIIPELKRLKKEYDITVISHADREQMKAGYVQKEVLEGIKVLHFPKPVIAMADKVKALFSYLLSKDGRQEIVEICRGKSNIRERLYQSLSFYAQALADQKEIHKSGVVLPGGPVIYYSFWNTYYCYSMVREKRKHKNVKIVSRFHGFDLYHERIPGNRQVFKHQMEAGTEGLIFLGEFARKYYIEKVKADSTSEEKLHVCPLGIEAAGRKMPLRQSQTLQLLSCSDVIPLKRVERIIDGLACVEQGEVHWTHIGDGPELAKVKAYAAGKLEKRSNIRYTFKGQMEHDQVLQYYETQQADCFITTSSTEGVPVSIMEAMSYGVPVIATAVGGIPEMIGRDGILLDGNPTGEEVGKAINSVLTLEKTGLCRMKDKSYEIWQQRYDIDKSIKILVDILRY